MFRIPALLAVVVAPAAHVLLKGCLEEMSFKSIVSEKNTSQHLKQTHEKGKMSVGNSFIPP